MLSRYSLIAVVLLASAAGARASDWKKEFKIDSLHQKAPQLSFVDENGKAHQLSEYRGKRVMLHLWATWCETCRTEMPKLSEMIMRAGKAGADPRQVLLLVSIDDLGKKKEVLDFIRGMPGHPEAYQVVKESSNSDFWGWGVPVTYFIDEQGRVAARALGSRDWSTISAADTPRFLDAALAK